MDGEGNLTKGERITDMSLSGFKSPVRDPLDGNSKLELQFEDEITKAFYIEYQTVVLVGNGDAVTNTLNVSEEGITTIQTVEKEEVIVKTTTSSGSGTSRRGYLVISKFGEINKEKLAGVSFSLYRKTIVNGKPVETLMRSGTTNQDGTLRFSQLRSGTYILKEEKPADGMLINGNYAIGKQELAGIEVVINNLKENHSDNETNVEVMNYLPTVRVTKKGNGLSLVGTVLELYEANELGEVTNNIPVETITMNATNVGGVIEFSQGIKLNQHYVVKERSAAPGYIRYTGNLLAESIAHGSHNEATTKIEFTNYQGSATFKKVNAKGSGVQGATFYVYDAVTDSRVEGVSIKTQSNGIGLINNLKPGTYYVQEHEAPQNYVKNPEKSNEFVIKDTTDSLVAPQPVKVTWKDNEETLINYQGSVKLNKVNKVNQPLQGATFTLYREKIGGTVVGTYTTNSLGELLINNLGSGNYVLVETKAAPGYLVNDTPFLFTIVSETSVALPTIDLGTLTNYQLIIGFSKIDQFNQPLHGAKFEVIQRNGSPLNSSIKYSIVYDEHDSSKFTITGLPVGRYRLKETVTPIGYIENTALYFDVTEKMMNVIANSEDQVYSNEAGVPISIALTNYKAGLSIKKFGEKNAILTDVVFTLYDADESGNPKPETGRELEFKNDSYILKDTDLLSPGKYVLEETKGSEGYIRNTRKELITVDNSHNGPY